MTTRTVDGIDMLEDQHRELDLALCRVRAGRTAPDRMAAFRDLSHQLILHLALEERLLHPLITTRGAAAEVTQAADEHLTIRRLLAHLMETDPEEPPFAERLAALGRALATHARCSETGLFATARTQLEPASLATLAQRIMATMSRLDERDALLGVDVGVGGATVVALG